MNKKMLIMVAGALLLGGGGSAAFFMMRSPGASAQAAPVEPPSIVSMETFLVNINSPGGDRFAKMNLRLTVSPGSVAETIGEDEVIQAKMRDRILTLLTSKSLEELIGPVGKEALRREIKAHLGPLIEDGEIQEVLFSDFVVQ